jgi:hypothetical protein
VEERGMARQADITAREGVIFGAEHLTRTVKVPDRVALPRTNYAGQPLTDTSGAPLTHRAAWVDEIIWLNTTPQRYQVYARGPLVKKDGGDHAVQWDNSVYWSVEDTPEELRGLLAGPRAIVETAIANLQRITDTYYPQG